MIIDRDKTSREEVESWFENDLTAPSSSSESESVLPSLLLKLAEYSPITDKVDNLTYAEDLAAALVEFRSDFGLSKYGQRLLTFDGRDPVQDALEEFGDLLQYAWKARMEEKDLFRLKKLIPILVYIIYSVNYGISSIR